MLSKQFRVAAVVAILTGASAVAPARADGLITGVVRSVVDSTGHLIRGSVTATGDIVDASGRVVGHTVNGAVDATGNIIDASGNVIGHISGAPGSTTTTYTTTTVSPDTYILSDSLVGVIDSRRLAYDALINDTLTRGAINAVQAAEYRATLQRLATAEANYQADKILSYDEALSLGRDLDSFGSTLYSVTGTSPWSQMIVTANGATRLSLLPTYYAATVASSPSSSTTTQTTVTSTTTTGSGEVVVSSNPSSIVTTSPSTVITTTLPATSTTYIRMASPELLVTTIETRRKYLDRMIDAARDQGKITRRQADAMKADLKRIARETGSNTITYERAVSYAQDLDLIGSRVGTVVVTGIPTYVPIINGSHFTVLNGQILELDDLSVRRADLEARITKDYLEGRLTDSQVAQLRGQLDSIATTKAVWDSTGQLDFKASRVLYKDFDKVASELERYAGKDNN